MLFGLRCYYVASIFVSGYVSVNNHLSSIFLSETPSKWKLNHPVLINCGSGVAQSYVTLKHCLCSKYWNIKSVTLNESSRAWNSSLNSWVPVNTHRIWPDMVISHQGMFHQLVLHSDLYHQGDNSVLVSWEYLYCAWSSLDNHRKSAYSALGKLYCDFLNDIWSISLSVTFGHSLIV